VGLPMLRPAQQQDPDLGHGRAIPGKEAARALLRHWLAQPEESRGPDRAPRAKRADDAPGATDDRASNGGG